MSEYLRFAKFETKLNAHHADSQEKLLMSPFVNGSGISVTEQNMGI